MRGLETVVRPVIFPDIRPRAKQSLPPQDDPDKGLAVIKGNPSLSADLTHSWSASSSQQRPVELERRVDVVRNYQKDDAGNINKQNFVDMEVANKITTQEDKAGGTLVGYTKPTFYQPLKEPDNVEVLQRDKIVTPEDSK